MTDAEKVVLLSKALEEISTKTTSKYFPCKKEEKLLSCARIQSITASVLRKLKEQ